MSTSVASIRTATLEDLPVLLAFEQEIIKAERPFDVTIKEDPVSYYDLGQMIQDSNARVVVASLAASFGARGELGMQAGTLKMNSWREAARVFRPSCKVATQRRCM